MAAVGLIYVGAVLFLNGAMLLGWVEARSAAPLNLFVGILQVITPTFLIFTAAGDPVIVLNASGLYLFGFTYLYVACNLFFNLDGTGLGYFSLFVAVAAVAYSLVNFMRLGDPVFGVIWLYWAFLWLLFFLVLGRGMEGLGRYTGAVAAIQGWATGALPAAVLLLGFWGRNATLIAWVAAIAGIVVFAAIYVPLRPKGTATPAPSGTPSAAAV
ncbi:AmiS/UreI family transporter [Pseudonocardia benzenivorans]|uniref:AmiS/UreI transporter n=2 Tax=Pseudonocardia TaxID=1847 RepID=F4CRF6_PSEUX|nr:AmiS/UreI family transporter [Pseudonocardia dioxanivorans]AEA25247.1 AmiS/UreI transporter [Pseudonocardia dioxanivorans CB1190]GJF04028.1 transporter [Pseudonocardia sp. D17]